MEQLVIALFLSLFALEFFIEAGLNELNLRYVRQRWAEKRIPDFFKATVSSEAYDKSSEYTLAKGRFQRWSEVYGRLVTLVVLFSGLLPFLDRFSAEMTSRFLPFAEAHGILFCFSVGLVFSLASLPADLYSTFGIESRFGFNKTTVPLYVKDRL